MFVGIDTLAILLGVLTASIFGESYGGEISPNIPLLVLIFFLTRVLLHWMLFKSVIRRSFDWARSLIQSIALITSLSLVTFSLVGLSTFAPLFGRVSYIFLFFGQLQSSAFYYLLFPVVTVFLSMIIHKFYKLEPW